MQALYCKYGIHNFLPKAIPQPSGVSWMVERIRRFPTRLNLRHNEMRYLRHNWPSPFVGIPSSSGFFSPRD